MERISFTVSFVLPDDASVDEARDYVADAVGTYCKSYRPLEVTTMTTPAIPCSGWTATPSK
jgi:hypothetical protein